MGKSKSSDNVKVITKAYARTLDPPLVRHALQALLEKRQSEFHEACAIALTNGLPMPDRKDYELDRIRRIVGTLNCQT